MSPDVRTTGEQQETGSSKPKVLVMMASYRGGKWIKEQLDSILAQSDVDVTVRICDDQSPDDTFSICQGYAERFSNVVVTQNEHNLGVAENFMQMVYDPANRGYDYYAFSDQDDIWIEDKLSVAAHAISNVDDGGAIPTLYYSDIVNFSDAGESLELSRFRECDDHPLTLLIRNFVDGCAMVFNAALFDLVASYRPNAFPRLHDTWVHMVATYCGQVIRDYDNVLVRRRISGENVIGEFEKDVKGLSGFTRLVSLATKDYKRTASETASYFLEGYTQRIDGAYLPEIVRFHHYRDSIRNRIAMAVRNDFWLPTAQMRARLFVALMLGFY